MTTDVQKIEAMVKALVEINETIYAQDLKLGSEDYFKVRCLCVDTLKHLDLYPGNVPRGGAAVRTSNQNRESLTKALVALSKATTEISLMLLVSDLSPTGEDERVDVLAQRLNNARMSVEDARGLLKSTEFHS